MAWTLSLSLLASLAAPACDMPEDDGAALAAAGSDDEPVDSLASELDLSNYKSAAQVICDLVDNIPGGNLVGINIQPPRCTFTNYDDLYYLGSYRRPTVIGPNAPQPSRRPIAMADALFCALKDSDGATADGTIPTGVGKFGISSRIEVPKKDPAARQLVGQRVGTIWAFGVGMDLDNQDFVVSFPTEAVGSFLGRTTGYYMDLQTSTMAWNIAASGVIGLFTLSIDFGQDGFFRSLQNNAIALRSLNNHGQSDPANAANPQFFWDNVYASCDPCRASGAFFCTCPSSADITQHNAHLGWSDDTYRNLGDQQLPYTGATGGVSGRYVYSDPSLNWTQLGYTKGGTGSGDPDNSGARSTHFNLGIKLDYEIISLGLTLGVGFRSGMELVQGSYFANEFRDHYATVKTSLEAQSSANLTARLVIRNPFPFGPDNLVDESFDIFNEHTDNHPTEAARIEYDYAQGFPFHDYSSAATGNQWLHAPEAHDACLAVPVQNNPLSPPGSPKDFVNQVNDAAKSQLFPCHVKMCSIDGPGTQYRGHLRTCEWNRSTQHLDCVDTGEACLTCSDSSADLCDAQGNVYHPKFSSHPGLPCQIF